MQSNEQHLDISLKEKRLLNEKYYEKIESTSLSYQETIQKINELKLNVAQAETIKKDRDHRFAEYRKTIEDLEATAHMATKKANFMESELKSLTKDHDLLKKDYDACSKNL